jgi:Mg2+-importing ATPase
MLAQQLIVQNLLYDFSQIAIPWDHVDEELLRKPCTWSIGGILKFMAIMGTCSLVFFISQLPGPVSSIFDITTFSYMFWYFGANSADSQSLFQSAWFVEGLLTQVFHTKFSAYIATRH